MPRTSKPLQATSALTIDLNDPALNERVDRYIDWWAQYKPNHDGCIVSDHAASDPRGYTLKTCPILQKQDYVHRVAYRVFVDDIPDGKVIRHKCNNPPCMNPQHLVLGTQQENIQDKMLAGRHRSSPRGKGLSQEKVTRIKQDLAGGLSGYAAAMKHGVSQMTVSNIRRGKTYKAITVDKWAPSPTRRPGRPPKKPSSSASISADRRRA